MTRAENSVLIALADLQTMEQERSERVLQQRRAEHERLERQEQERERIAQETRRRRAAEQEARRLETERRQAAEAAEARERLERAEAKARAEQDARLADVQRELSAALDRREMRRTGRLAVVGMGTALLASAAAIAVWMGMSQPVASPHVATVVPDVAGDVDAMSRRLAEIRADNAALRGDLEEIQARAKATAEAAAVSEDETEAPEPTPAARPGARPNRPHRGSTIRRPKPRPTSKKDGPVTTKRPNPLVFEDGDPLAGLEKKPK